MEELIIISRRTTIVLSDLYEAKFTVFDTYDDVTPVKVSRESLYDFLYENNYPHWLCNKAQRLFNKRRQVKEFIMKLHTGEIQSDVTKRLTWKQRRQLGQKYIYKLAEDILIYYHKSVEDSNFKGYTKSKIEDPIKRLTLNLELDGYIFYNNRLLMPEIDVLEIKEEMGLLETLYNTLSLENKELSIHHLKLSEEHYLAKRWDDCISNSRKFFENVLREVASTHSQRCKKVPLKDTVYEYPFKVREYLEKEGLLESKEMKAIAEVYGLLSETGSHPYMASSDQARLLRQTALTFSQFVMLRFEGFLKKVYP